MIVLLCTATQAAAVNTARFTVSASGTIAQNTTGTQSITVTNVGPNNATSVVIKYKPPTTTGVTVNSVIATPGGACTLNAGVYTCPTIASVLLNGTVTLSVNLTVSGSAPVGSTTGSSVSVNSAEYNPASGTGETLFSIWGARGVSGAAGDAFWFAFDGTYSNTGYKSETNSTGTTPLTTDWPVNQANPRGAYNIKADDATQPYSDNATYAPYGTANSTTQSPKNQTVETSPVTITLPVAGNNTSQNNRRVWEVRTGIYLNSAQTIYVCLTAPDDAMYVAIDPATSGTIAAFSSTYTAAVTTSGGTALTAGYHEIIYRIFNRNNQSSSFERGAGGFGALGIGTTSANCDPTNYTALTSVAPATDLTVTPTADLAIQKTGPSSAVQGSTVAYTIKVWNNGPSAINGAAVADTVPSNLTGVSWTCVATGSAACSTSNGSGNTINVSANLTPDSGSSTTADTNYVTLTVSGTATDAGTVTNTATVSAPNGTTDLAGNNTSSVTTTITLPASCSVLYGTFGGDFTTGNNNGTEIRTLSDTSNAVGALIASIPATSGGQAGYTATLAITPDRSRFFVIRDVDTRLMIFNVATGQWTEGPQLPTTSSRYVRMAITSNNVGYVMDGDGNFYSFATTSPYTVSAAQTLTRVPSSAPTLGTSGDFFADNRGNLFLLSSTGTDGFLDFWEIEPSTRNLVYLGRITDADIVGNYGGFGVTAAGVFGRGGAGRMINVDLKAFTATQVGPLTSGSTDLASCYFPSLTRSVSASKTATRVGGGTVVVRGDTLIYTITVRNTGTAASGNTQFQDAIPAGTTYVPGSTRLNGATVTDGAGGAMPFTVSGQLINSPGQQAGTLLVDQTPSDTTDREAVISFQVTVNSSAGGQVSNQGSVNYRDDATVVTVLTDDPQTPLANDATVTTVYSPADLAIDKSGAAAVGSGGVVTYILRVWNNGPSSVSGVSVTDTLPAGFTVTGISCAATGTATCGTQTFTASSVTITTGTLSVDTAPTNAVPDGNFLTYTLTGTAPTSGTLSNTASVVVPGRVTDGVTGNNTSGTVTTLIVDAVNDAAVNLTFGAGGTVNVLGNDTVGGAAATTTNVSVSIVDKGGLTGLSVNSGQLNVPPGMGSGSYTVTYQICSVTTPTACDTATVPINIGTATADVSITKTAVGFAKPGDTITYTLTVGNAGPNAADGVSVTDTLPTGVTYVSSTPAGAVSGQTLTWTLGTLPAGGSQVITVVVTAPVEATLLSTPATRTLTNTASVSSATTDPTPANNTATAVTQMVGAKLTKSVRNVTQNTTFGTSGGGLPGEVLEYCIAFENIGAVALPNFVVTDQVPGNTNAQTGGYDAEEASAATGFGVKLTRSTANPTTSYFTSAADADVGALSSTGGSFGRGTMTVNLGALTVGEKGSVCFRTAIR
ncbi:beta strand repeat-containing protein [Deinococcus sp. PEB2-63]